MTDIGTERPAAPETSGGCADLAWRIDGGAVMIDPGTGAPNDLRNDADPARRYVLTQGHDAWHTSEQQWGAGAVVTDQGSWRWNHPDELVIDGQLSTARFRLGPPLVLTVERAASTVLTETYTLANTGSEAITVGTWSITVPVRDVYDDAAASLREGVHAHIWTGGADAWIIGQPMDGAGQCLLLRLVEGSLCAYSIESRNHFTSSNVRGHIVLHPTDAARNPDAFGGQSPIVLAPGGTASVTWEVRFTATSDAAEQAVRRAWHPPSFCAEVGVPVLLGSGASGQHVSVVEADAADVDAHAIGVELIGRRHGIAHVDIGDERIALLFHDPLNDIVRARVAFIIANQRATQRPAPDDAAFVPYDNRTGLTQLTSGWPDWSDGAERTGMPSLIQQAALARLVPAEDVRTVLERWAVFARVRLLDENLSPKWGSDTIMTEPRLYNAPWLAQFFADQYRLFGADGDLDTSARILERSYAMGAEEHLSIGQPEAVVSIAGLLDDAGYGSRAEHLRTSLLRSAAHFSQLGIELPSHEVNYEQSMVAPLVSLYAAAERLQPGTHLDDLAESVRWLRAFAGPQPHARMHNVPIRHWDGYWFGALRRWGDVFPHYWAVLSAVALHELPGAMQTPEIRREIDDLFHANLASFAPDGSATAAFVLPSMVDGIRGYTADPLANDQDWALTLWLRALNPGDAWAEET